jgi:hypothetical protein
LAGGVLRVIGRLLLEGVIEIAIKGTGCLICRPFKRRVDPDGGLVVAIGIAFWVAVGAVIYWACARLERFA